MLKDTGFHVLCATRVEGASETQKIHQDLSNDHSTERKGLMVPNVAIITLFKDGGVGLYHIRRKQWIFNREHVSSICQMFSESVTTHLNFVCFTLIFFFSVLYHAFDVEHSFLIHSGYFLSVAYLIFSYSSPKEIFLRGFSWLSICDLPYNSKLLICLVKLVRGITRVGVAATAFN